MTLTVEAPARSWIDICPLDRLILDRGVAAKVGPSQVAVFRVGHGRCDERASAPADGEPDLLYALSNYDPFSMANVLSRGIVGCRDGRLKVASPVYKQSFDLATGECLDDPAVSVPTFEVRVLDGHVQVALPS
ncbi:MAG: nitrite reductase small subunit NirD [Actinomycetota bacterium]|nr:nitrite reductase small subunit NirD [Actinomycetota bacterium]